MEERRNWMVMGKRKKEGMKDIKGEKRKGKREEENGKV